MNAGRIHIGEVATRAGLSVDTLRYYERVGLLPRAPRSSGGYRLFDDQVVERVVFIKQAQELGFSLAEIKGLLTTGGAEECRRVRDLLRAKIGELDARMKAMKRFRRTLTSHLSACERELRTHGKEACCPVVTASRRKASGK